MEIGPDVTSEASKSSESESSSSLESESESSEWESSERETSSLTTLASAMGAMSSSETGGVSTTAGPRPSSEKGSSEDSDVA